MQKLTWSLALAVVVVTVGCGDARTSMNPVAPSAVVIDAQSQDAGADSAVSGTTGGPRNGGGNGNGNGGGGNGNGNGGGGNGNGNGGDGNGNGGGNGNQPTPPRNNQPPSNTSPTAPGQRKVELQGPITSKGGDTITVRGQLVVVPTDCVIRHGSTTYDFSELRVGDLVHVRADRVTEGSGATAATSLEASEIKLQNAGFDDGAESDSMVSVSATDATADESGTNAGNFRLTRTGSAAALATALTVTVAVSGTATNGIDYQPVLLTVTFPATQTTVDVPVTPLADTTVEAGGETVILSLTTLPAPYELGSPSTATVTITDALSSARPR